MKLDNKGMTLMELLISIALISMVLIFLFQLIGDLKNETNNNNFAYNNQINRTEAIVEIQKDLEKNTLVGITDKSSHDGISLDFHYKNGTNTNVANLSITKETAEDADKYYLKYTNNEGELTSWEMKNAIVDPCGLFTYYSDNSSKNYYFKINIYVYTNHENNSKSKNNAVDDIEITYTGEKYDLNLGLSNNLINSTNSHITKKIGNCAE